MKNPASTNREKRRKNMPRRLSAPRHDQRPWFRLLLLANSAFLAVFIGWMADNNLITLTLVIFGSLATDLVSEKTLVKILPWNRK